MNGGRRQVPTPTQDVGVSHASTSGAFLALVRERVIDDQQTEVAAVSKEPDR